MQAFFGVAIFLVILGGSIFLGSRWVNSNSVITNDPISKLTKLVITSLIMFIVGYAILFILCGIVWVVAWLGILLREIIQWLYESLIYPFSWFF